jgi:succinate-acetate transporter protein
MSVSEHGSISQVERALGFIPDTNDPTAGRIAISREMASEQVRLIADPAPLGLGAFALTTFLLSLANAGVMPAKAEPIVFGVALAYGGIAQILAGMWEFRKSNVFGATVFTSYGAFWVSFWAYVTFYAPEVPTELLFAVVAVVFFLLGLGALSASPVLTVTGGFLGIIAAGLAWYLCLAGIAASTFGRPILPNPPLFTS